MERGIPAHQEMESGLLTSPFPRGEGKDDMTSRMKSGKKENAGKKKKGKTARERTQRLLNKTARVTRVPLK